MFDVLWFVLAGFVLGFAASLLWEWLYFRKRRLQWQSTEITQLEEQIRSLQSQLSQGSNGFLPPEEQTRAAGRAPVQSDDFLSGAARMGIEQPADKAAVRQTSTRHSSTKTVASPDQRSDEFSAPAQEERTVSEFAPESSSMPRPNKDGEIQGFDLESFVANARDMPVDPFANQSDNPPTTEQFPTPPTAPEAVETRSQLLHQQPQQMPSSAVPQARTQTHSGLAQSRVEKVTAVQADSMVPRSEETWRSEEREQQPAEFSPNTQAGQPQLEATQSEAAGSEALADAWADPAEGQSQPLNPNFTQDAYQDPEEQVIDARNIQQDAGFNPSAVAGTANEFGVTEDETNPSVDSEIGNETARASREAMSDFDTLYGQQGSEPQALYGGPAGSGPAENEPSTSAPLQELGHDADVDFSVDETERATKALDNFTYDDEDMDLPTVSKVMTNYEPPEHELSSYTPPSSEQHSSEPQIDEPSSSERTWSEEQPKDEHRYESALRMPAEIMGAPTISRPLTRMTLRRESERESRREMGSGNSLLIRGVQQAPIDHPDDLTKIKGIGSVFQERLYATGIYTWDQLSKSKPETLEAATQPRINADFRDWITQAQVLAQTHQRVGATYSGPMPDNLSVITGLTPGYMLWLYQNGIASYMQLAQAKKSTLTQIFTGVSGAKTIDFSTWAREARKLARLT